MSSLIPSILVLSLAAIAALLLAMRRPSPARLVSQRAEAAKALTLATAIQSAHFAEEWATGFHVRFPALFGLEPMPLGLFVGFNLTWIAIWVASIPLLRSARIPALFAAWFLAIAGMLNGLAHPMLAVASTGYFPGLMTSPFIGLAGVWLWRQLNRATLAVA